MKRYFTGVWLLFIFFAYLSCKGNSSLLFQASSGEASDAFLKNILVKADEKPISLSSVFSSSVYNYEVTLPYKTTNIKIEAMKSSASSTITMSPENIDIAKVAGASVTCVISVVSSNKEVKHRYVVQLTRGIPSRENRASSLVLSYGDGKVIPLNEAFYSGKLEYTANISDDFNGELKLKAYPYSFFALSKEEKKNATEAVTKLEVEVKAEDESVPVKKYSVSVSKIKQFANEDATDLSIISVAYKGKYAEYDGATNAYVLYVPIQDSKDTIKNALEIKTYAQYTLEDFDSSIDFPSTDGLKKLYLINVHNKAGKNRNYKLILIRGENANTGKSNNTDLARIEFITDANEIKPIDCLKNKSDVYNVPLHKGVNKVQIMAIAVDDKAAISVDPQVHTNITTDEKKSFTITVRAENGTEKKYVVNVVKNLSSFVRVISEKKKVSPRSLDYLDERQKLNYLFTGAFSSSDVEVLPYEIGIYEVNYKLWFDVRKWAELQGYNFNNKGCQGENTGKISSKKYEQEGVNPTNDKQYNPVTGISYRDAIIWCNAYSEMNDLRPVYYFDGKILKDATLFKLKLVPTTNGQFLRYEYYYADMATKDTEANGYRLPTTIEWEMAARGGDDEKEEWNYAFPGVKGFEDGKPLFKNQAYAFSSLADYAWYLKNAQKQTHDIGEKKPNSLGIYDMAGNVYEICEEVKKYENPDDSLDPRYNTFIKGGSYQIGGLFPFTPPYSQDAYFTESKGRDIGFRLARSLK
ncbi:MAG: formylglycine-generating enzyme family protein [Treponema sp.]